MSVVIIIDLVVVELWLCVVSIVDSCPVFVVVIVVDVDKSDMIRACRLSCIAPRNRHYVWK